MKLIRYIGNFFKEREKIVKQIEASKAFSLYLQDRLESKVWQLQRKTKPI
jgi:hypothetical protein